jgi:hypothetical protein
MKQNKTRRKRKEEKGTTKRKKNVKYNKMMEKENKY